MLGIILGSARLNILEALKDVVNGNYDSADARILVYVRFPRVAASLVCGMALAVSGAVIQGVLANKLASPSIIGINAGAGIAVTLCAAFGILGGFSLSALSFLGAFLTALLVSIGAKRWGVSGGTVILFGVALNALLGAISDTVTTFVPEVTMLRNDYRIGDFSSATYAKVIPAAVIIIPAILVLLTLSNELDVLTLGDENAKSLGMNTRLMGFTFLMLSALLAGTAVSVCGLLSFVGLLVPHAIRRTASGKSKHLLPLCALYGAGFVTLCDTVSRTVFAPYELPVGIIMAFLGAPFFIFILLKGKGGKTYDRTE